ncbi:MAG TPA: Nudix family hydrolase [Leucothrix mucor]|nr:Nudix family hydrolase [Leucothrix mucor]
MLHIVAAVIRDKNNLILIAQRASKQHQGGKWEFSGGKVENGETAQQALARELDEELGIQIAAATPLIQVHHHYPDLSVFLDIYEVTAWQGEAYGKEGQAVRWVSLNEMSDYSFPAANKPILQALQLADLCLITPEIVDEDEFKQDLLCCLDKGIKLIQFRAKTLSEDDYIKRASWLFQQCSSYQCQLVFNSPPTLLTALTNQGLHLTSYQLLAQAQRPDVRLLSAACHNEIELQKAQELGVDFVFLSPIQATTSHPDAEGKGWDWFNKAVRQINVPVYALGGLGKDDLETARNNGAQGVAAISQLWV